MFRANIRLVTTATDAGFAGVGNPRPESKRLTDRSHHGSAKPSRTSIGYSGARARTWASRLTVARLTARLHRNESGRRGSRTPKAEAHPFSRRDTRLQIRRRCRLHRRRPPRPESTPGYPIEVIMARRQPSRTSIGSAMSRPAGAERCFPSLSPTLRPWIDGSPLAERRPTWRSFGARSLLAGLEMRRLKLTLIGRWISQRAAAEIFLSQAGPRFRLRTVSS